MGFDTLWLKISKPPEGLKFGCLEPRCKKSKNLNNSKAQILIFCCGMMWFFIVYVDVYTTCSMTSGVFSIWLMTSSRVNGLINQPRSK